jgi:MFS family permease
MWSLIRRNRALRRIVLFQLFSGLQLGTFGLLFNLYLLTLGHKEDLIGLIASASTLALSFMALSAGRLVQRFGLRQTMGGGLTLSLLAALGLIFSPNAFFLILFSVLSGMGVAMMQSLQMPLLAEHVGAEDRATGAALVSALATLSNTAGTLIGGFFPALLGLLGLGTLTRDRVALTVAVGLGAVALVPLIGLRGGGGTPQGFSAAIGTVQEDRLRPQTRRMINNYAGATALISLGAGAFLPFVNVYLARLGANSGEIGGLLSGVGIFGAVLGLGAPALARFVGRERLSVIARVLPIFPALLLVLMPSIPFVVLTFAIRNAGAGMTWPIEAAILNDRIPARARAGAFGLRTAAWNLAWALSSALSGFLIVRGGYSWPIVILIASTIFGGVVLSFVLRPTAEERAKDTPARKALGERSSVPPSRP